MDAKCVHSCNGLCNALEVAEHHEEQTIQEYRQYASQCDYPDVKEVLDALIADREKALCLLREKRDILLVKLHVTSRINDSFA